MAYSVIHTPEFWEGWFGTPADVETYFFTDYEYLDDLFFMPKAREVFRNWTHGEKLIQKVEQKFRDRGWEGDGEMQLLWLPPFIAKSYFPRRPIPGTEWFHTDRCGFYALHVKQEEDGISFLASPKRLELDPDYTILNYKEE
jgi:hypothetical protein